MFSKLLRATFMKHHCRCTALCNENKKKTKEILNLFRNDYQIAAFMRCMYAHRPRCNSWQRSINMFTQTGKLFQFDPILFVVCTHTHTGTVRFKCSCSSSSIKKLHYTGNICVNHMQITNDVLTILDIWHSNACRFFV